MKEHNLDDIARIYAERHKVAYKHVRPVIKKVFAILADLIVAADPGDKIRIMKFGSWEIRKRVGRGGTVKQASTGKIMSRVPKNPNAISAKWKASRSLWDRLGDK